MRREARTAVLLLAATLSAMPAVAQGSAAHAAQPSELTALVERFTEAQHGFDQATLARLTEESYIEISPLGEVDPRAKMLGFYAPEKRTAPPPMPTMSEFDVRVYGDAGIVIAKLHWEMPGHPVEMRTTFVAHHGSEGWKLVSTAYTGIRPPAKQATPGS